jgi:hypothetical protein
MKKMVIILMFLFVTVCQHTESTTYVKYIPDGKYGVPALIDKETGKVIRVLPPTGFFKHID